MDSLTIIFLVATIIGGVLVGWTYTKSGKKWLNDL
jgi:hypothetical protein